WERAEDLRDLCERWLREVLATPTDPDPYQRDRRSITLHKLTLELVTLPEPVAFDAGLAVNAVREAIALDGGWYGWMVLGAIHCRVGRPDEALQAFEAATQQPNWSGGNDLYWFVLAATYSRRGELARAAECYERAQAADTKRDSWANITE